MVRDSLLADVVEADTISHGSIVAQVHGFTRGHRRAAAAPFLITATTKKSAIDAFRRRAHRLGYFPPAHRLFRTH